jgi:hypothetical protein
MVIIPYISKQSAPFGRFWAKGPKWPKGVKYGLVSLLRARARVYSRDPRTWGTPNGPKERQRGLHMEVLRCFNTKGPMLVG